MGHAFLKHLARCAAILHLIDISAEDPVANYKTLRKELAVYDDEFGEALSAKTEIIVLNKTDMVGEAEAKKIAASFARKTAKLTKVKPLVMSVRASEGIDTVLKAVAKLVSAARGNA